MVLKSSGPIAKPLSASGLTKHYGSLRYTVKYPIPSPEDLDLSREENYFNLEEPQPQQALRAKVNFQYKNKNIINNTDSNFILGCPRFY